MPARNNSVSSSHLHATDFHHDHGAFLGFIYGGYFFPAIAPRPGHGSWRVRTFAQPMSPVGFIAMNLSCLSNLSAKFRHATIPLVDRHGRLLRGALRVMMPLLSDDERALLALFGVRLR